MFGVMGDAGRGSERDSRELAINTRLNLEDKAGDKSCERIAFPTPPRPMRTTGIGRVGMMFECLMSCR